MEFFEINDGVVSVGRRDYIRVVAAQQRLLRDNCFVPLQVLSSLGKDVFQDHANRPQLYSQGSGVAHFLLHYDNGAFPSVSSHQPAKPRLERQRLPEWMAHDC